MIDVDAMTPEELTAALGYPRNFARMLRAGPGRCVEFAYDLDPARWPWLCLPPTHPVLLDKVQYFSAVTASLAAGSMAPGTRSALTLIRWSAAPGAPASGHAERGLLEPWQRGEKVGYSLRLFARDGGEIARVEGEGAAFADRDFGAWRAAAKSRAAALGLPTPSSPVDPASVGLGAAGVAFVSPDREVDGERSVAALVTRESGFPPAHPFHTGTGDHVNAGHLLDCALQAAHLLAELPDAPLACAAGQAEFLRFVELDVPFEIRRAPVEAGGTGRTRLGFRFFQGERENARIQLELAPEPG